MGADYTPPNESFIGRVKIDIWDSGSALTLVASLLSLLLGYVVMLYFVLLSNSLTHNGCCC